MHYQIIFSDFSSFTGNALEDKWKLLPNKRIIKWEFKLAKHQIIFENYEAYNLVVEKYQIMGSQPGQCGVFGIILMAKKGHQVLKIRYNALKGKVTQEIALWGKEYRDKPHKYWKMGVNGKASYKII